MCTCVKLTVVWNFSSGIKCLTRICKWIERLFWVASGSRKLQFCRHGCCPPNLGEYRLRCRQVPKRTCLDGLLRTLQFDLNSSARITGWMESAGSEHSVRNGFSLLSVSPKRNMLTNRSELMPDCMANVLYPMGKDKWTHSDCGYELWHAHFQVSVRSSTRSSASHTHKHKHTLTNLH